MLFEDTSEQTWKQRYTALEQRFIALEQRFIALEQKCHQLEAENQALREKLNTNSKNSSKPPSQDPFKKSRASKSRGRKPGGQPGHLGHERKVYPPEQVTQVIDLYPEACPNCCSTSFSPRSVAIESRQVIELPQMLPDVIQYHIHTCECLCCNRSVRANVPKEAERGFGPRLMGFLTMLTAEGHLSKRKICSIAQHLGVRISLGALCKIHKLAGELLEDPAQTIQAHVLQTGKVNADETSWRVLNNKCWMWIGAAPNATFFKIDPSRSSQAYLRIFGTFKGTLTTDRYGAYNQYTGRKQSCLAHIDRYFAKMSERPGIDGSFGRILEDQLDQIFSLWSGFKRGERSRAALQKAVANPVENVRVTLMFASREAKNSKTVALANDLLNRFETLWTFLYEDGVEPTNNLAERGLRPAVILRKLTYGNQSEWGAEFTERLMTIACTLKQNSTNLLEFLTHLFDAHHGARSPPVLNL